MRGAVDQERAAIPFGRLMGIKDVFALLEIERVPHRHRHPDVERERERVRDDRVVNRRHRIEIGPYRQHVLARHLRVGIVGHRGIETFAVASDTLADRVVELIVRPGPDPGLHVGRDVRRNDAAERRFDRASASERLVLLWDGVTARAIRKDRQVSSPVDRREILRVDLSGRRCAVADAERGKQRRRAGEEIEFVALTHRPTALAF